MNRPLFTKDEVLSILTFMALEEGVLACAEQRTTEVIVGVEAGLPLSVREREAIWTFYEKADPVRRLWMRYYEREKELAKRCLEAEQALEREKHKNGNRIG